MDNNVWSVIIIEQETEEIKVHSASTEKEAYAKLREIWEHDIATEVNESSRQVDFNKSFCDDNYAELWYNAGDSAIKYFANEITDYSGVSKSVVEDTVIVLGQKINFGTIVSKIVWHGTNNETVRQSDAKVIAIGEQFIVIINTEIGLMRVDIENIKEIVINQ